MLNNGSIAKSVIDKGVLPKDTIIKYVWKKNRKNNPKGVLIAFVEDDKVFIGFSSYNEKQDIYNKYIAWTIAENRAKKIFTNRKIYNLPVIFNEKIPKKTKEEDEVEEIVTETKSYIERFIEVCLSSRRFKGKSFPKWINTYINTEKQ